ncbi:hypothetical protein GQ43DRAFT_365064 [Delitschia confertaspora ATCC 74209]|uniref:Uncharacterized protein n=1 Tax=Delitschia confertaspora ATCC 74209 TaxID=1513339 RepID=A0A9P4JXB4_9PLEO|nr:hypothetical protein GQ43DRAFT_365064 [Delitschia confertaspora ATCC 74209]
MPIFQRPDVTLRLFKMPLKLPTIKMPSLDVLKPKPVFNRPVNLRRRAGQVPKWLSITFLASQILVSTAVMGLKAATINFVRENGTRGFMFTLQNSRHTVLAALPKDLYSGTAKLALMAAISSTLFAVCHMVFVLRERKHNSKPQTYIFRRNVMFLNIINTLLILFSMVALFVTHKSSSHFSVRYMSRKGGFGKDGIYNRGTFDLETWSCELQSIPGAKVAWDDYASQCRIEVAGRMMMVPFLLLGIGVTCISVAQMMGCQRDGKEQSKPGLEDFEMSKFNAV